MFVKSSSNIKIINAVKYIYNKKRTPKKNKHSIVLLLVKNRKNTTFATKYSCNLEDWSFETNMLKTNKKGNDLKKIKEINNFIGETNKNIEKFISEKNGLEIDFSLDDVINEIKSDDKKINSNDYYCFHQEIFDEFKLSNKISSAKINRDTLNSIKLFHGKENLKFSDLNYEFISK